MPIPNSRFRPLSWCALSIPRLASFIFSPFSTRCAASETPGQVLNLLLVSAYIDRGSQIHPRSLRPLLVLDAFDRDRDVMILRPGSILLDGKCAVG